MRWNGRPSGKNMSIVSGAPVGRSRYSRLAGPENGVPAGPPGTDAQETVPSSRKRRPPSSGVSVKRTTPVKDPRVPVDLSRRVRSTVQEPSR